MQVESPERAKLQGSQRRLPSSVYLVVNYRDVNYKCWGLGDKDSAEKGNILTKLGEKIHIAL